MKDTLVYKATVLGHKVPDGSAYYAVDTIIGVEDEVEDIAEDMWCLSRRFYNDGRGPKTDLELIRKGSITL